jgi:hypothetical protein
MPAKALSAKAGGSSLRAAKAGPTVGNAVAPNLNKGTPTKPASIAAKAPFAVKPRQNKLRMMVGC